MKALLKRLEDCMGWVYAEDYRTWISHALVGFLIMALCDVIGLGAETAMFSLAFFYGVREVPGLLKALSPFDGKLFRDHVLDLMAPFIGVVLYLVANDLIAKP